MAEQQHVAGRWVASEYGAGQQWVPDVRLEKSDAEREQDRKVAEEADAIAPKEVRRYFGWDDDTLGMMTSAWGFPAPTKKPTMTISKLNGAPWFVIDHVFSRKAIDSWQGTVRNIVAAFPRRSL